MNQVKLLIERLLGIDIIKVFSLNAMATLIRMLTGMISVKVVATIIGPSGIALLGQLNNFSTIVMAFAQGGINNGITKYVAEYKEDEGIIKKFISNALKITLICTLVVSMVLILGCVQLSEIILQSYDYYYVFLIFGFTLILYSLNHLLLSIINGYKQFYDYVKINICGIIINMIFTVVLVYFWGLTGALINAVTYQSIVFFVTLWMCRKMSWMKRAYFKEQLDRPIVKKYLGFSLMTLTTMILFPVSQLLLRGYVISDLSAADAGIWEGMNRISNLYLSVITTAFSIYYLPRISEITDPKELQKEVFRCYKVIVPILILICVSIYLLRYIVLWILFTPDFYSMESLFGWQLAGDLIKICSWMLSYILVAKARVSLFISSEIIFTFLYLILSFSFLHLNGITGLVQGYLANYIVYMLAMIVLFRYLLKPQKNV